MSEFSERRKKLLDSIGDGVALFPSAPAAIRNQDVEHSYRQDSDFFYLTGFDEPESVLILTNQHDEHREVLFVRPRKRDREIWDGPRAGVEGAVRDYGVDAAFPIDEFASRLPDYIGNVERLHYRVAQHGDMDKRVFDCLSLLRRGGRRGVGAPDTLIDSGKYVHEMRLRKSAEEIATMRRAAAITAEAHRRAMAVTAPGVHEYEVDAELLHVFRKHGSERPAYDAIVGSGPNATILHYRAGNRPMSDGELVLIDAGCELDYYASDVTRTFPVNGRFSAEQQAIYELVLVAQKEAIEAVRPGVTLEDIHVGAVRTLTDGLVQLGLLEGDVDALIEEKKYEPFYMHRTSHWLGMDVHDVGRYFTDGKHRPLEDGFVLTVEPGLYVATDNEDVDERWRGIGVRIEDDVAVTNEGFDVLTDGIPKEVAEVEAACG
ncbi:MAG: Xaa-Pro aminopeptidase [Myxococcota bacterium]